MPRHKTLLSATAFASAAMLLSAVAAFAGDSNAGDIWVDGATTQRTGVDAAGPGHENDPHLGCSDVGVFAAKMADPTAAEQNTFTLYAWPPTGSQNAIYTANWTYTKGAADPQEIAVIPISVFGAGGHFKIQVSQDPNKSKVFWIDCDAAGGGKATSAGTVGAGATSAPGATSSSPFRTSRLVRPEGFGGVGSIEADVATAVAPEVLGTESAAGAALADTGLPVSLLVLGLILVGIGAAEYFFVRQRRIVVI